MSSNEEKDWIEQVADLLALIPIVGGFFAGVVLMVYGFIYLVLSVTVLTFILIPYLAVRGIINPNHNVGAWKFFTGDEENPNVRPTHLECFVILSCYIVPFAAALYLAVS